MIGISLPLGTLTRTVCSAFVLAAVVALVVAPLPSRGQGAPVVSLCAALPYEEVGYLDGVKFKIRVPSNWNGTLLLYMQGFKTGPPPAEPALVPYTLKDSQPPLEATLLAQGYALAASQVGVWDMQPKEELTDSLALMTYFSGKVAVPARVVAWGNSLGGVTAVQMAEDHPRSIDGAIANCPGMLGWSRRTDVALDFAVAYAAAFGWPESWGPIGDLRPGLAADFNTDVAPRVVRPDATSRGKWEFIRLVMGFPAEAFWQADPVTGTSGMFLGMWATTYMREMLESGAGGPVATNIGRNYTLTPEEKTYLTGLNVNADELLAKMNANNEIAANWRAREYIRKYGDLRAMPRRPLLTMHNTLDCMADTRWQGVYRDEVEAAGFSANLVQAYVKGVGHCGFSSIQLLTALKAMERWLETGDKPYAASFPEADGFDNSFVPPLWPRR